MKNKLIKDCVKGDCLFCVCLPKHDEDHLEIFPVVIEEIKYDSFLYDTYTCKKIGSDLRIKFDHVSSDHDSLVLDTDYGYVNGNYGERVYSNYESALDWGTHMIQLSIEKKLKQLEYVEKRYGVSKNHLLVKETQQYYDEEKYEFHKKVVLYDTNCWDDTKPKHIEKNIKEHPIEVWKEYVEYDVYGNSKSCYKPEDKYVKKFDTVEDARRWIHEHDKSKKHGKNVIWYEGYRYYIKGIDKH